MKNRRMIIAILAIVLLFIVLITLISNKSKSGTSNIEHIQKDQVTKSESEISHSLTGETETEQDTEFESIPTTEATEKKHTESFEENAQTLQPSNDVSYKNDKQTGSYEYEEGGHLTIVVPSNQQLAGG